MEIRNRKCSGVKGENLTFFQEPEEWKFGTGSVPLAQTPRVVDETDNIIIIP